MLNQQKPLPAVAFGGSYLIHSLFLTIQGEGPFSGDAAVFVRLEGCNLQCPACDTDYTGGPRAQILSADDIVGAVGVLVGTSRASLVVLTGGEPFRQDLAELVDALMIAGHRAVRLDLNSIAGNHQCVHKFCKVLSKRLAAR